MKIFTAKQIRTLDEHTIAHESITSLDLMERAAEAVVQFVTHKWSCQTSFVIVAGSGNNGGDALAVARLLSNKGYCVTCYLFNLRRKLSPACIENKQRAIDSPNLTFHELTHTNNLPSIDPSQIVIDGLLGTGFSEPIAAQLLPVIEWINQSKATVVSIDIPSGLMSEGQESYLSIGTIKAGYTLTFEVPKFTFFLAESQPYIGSVIVLAIGITPEALKATPAQFSLIELREVVDLWRTTSIFAHKGSKGHGLVIGGNRGMAGASYFVGKAAFKCGIGKITLHASSDNRLILQTLLPEAILYNTPDESFFATPVDGNLYEATAIGCGLGLDRKTAETLLQQIENSSSPLVIDADAITLLGENPEHLTHLPKETILTPHPKELERLVGKCSSSYQRWQKTIEFAQIYQLYVIIKGHYSLICTPSGHTYINSTGNAGMATAGSGDVLTGILLALLAQGYSPQESCLIGVFLHGLSGDIAATRMPKESIMASDIIEAIPEAIKDIIDNRQINK